jgi:hypothetical protein
MPLMVEPQNLLALADVPGMDGIAFDSTGGRTTFVVELPRRLLEVVKL